MYKYIYINVYIHRQIKNATKSCITRTALIGLCSKPHDFKNKLLNKHSQYSLFELLIV